MVSFGELEVPAWTVFLSVLVYGLSLIEMFFYLGLFTRVKSGTRKENNLPFYHPPVSVIVCLRNETEQLRELIPAIMGQQHPDFELILVADRSERSTIHFLEQQQLRFQAIKLISVQHCPEGISPKKNALNHGIGAARHDVLLFTDADCIPAGKYWISRMAALYKPGIEVVLGYGGYKSRDSWLNLLIRTDTLITAGQYLGRALAGKPYMGVGRNLSYRKEAFLRSGGFAHQLEILSGDDDLLVGRLATSANTAVCLDPEAFTWSEPKETMEDWLNQKRRHFSVAPYYKLENKIPLGLFQASRSLGWLLLPVLFFLPYGTLPAGFLFFFRTGYRLFSMHRLNENLQAVMSLYSLWLMDILHSLFVAFIAIQAFFQKKNRW